MKLKRTHEYIEKDWKEFSRLKKEEEEKFLELNNNDISLLELCKDRPKSINEIARGLNISGASISVRVKKLNKAGLIKVIRKGKGKKTLIYSIPTALRKMHPCYKLDLIISLKEQIKRNHFLLGILEGK